MWRYVGKMSLEVIEVCWLLASLSWVFETLCTSPKSIIDLVGDAYRVADTFLDKPKQSGGPLGPFSHGAFLWKSFRESCIIYMIFLCTGQLCWGIRAKSVRYKV